MILLLLSCFSPSLSFRLLLEQLLQGFISVGGKGVGGTAFGKGEQIERFEAFSAFSNGPERRLVLLITWDDRAQREAHVRP